MIVYVESNFVLEIALEQREASSAEAILGLAENGEIELAIPAVALAEPFSKLGYRNVDRKTVADA